MKNIEVMVSVHYRGKGWYDEGTKLRFEQSMPPRVYRIPGDADLTGVKDAIRQNLLMLVSGDIGAAVKKKHVELVEVEAEKVEWVEAQEEKRETEQVEVEKEVEAEQVQEDVEVVEPKEDLSEKTLAELKEVAKERGIEHKAKITRKELLNLLEG